METLPLWASTSLSVGNLLGTFVTAIATIFLWKITQVLARETRRMADLAAQPHVVATIALNRWGMQYFDLHVDNTGNATAYDIQVSFDPPLDQGESRLSAGLPLPLQRISVLKPGQGLSSALADYAALKGKEFGVSVSWRPNPAKAERQVNAYTLSMADFEGTSRLGDDPLVEIANHLKKAQADWSSIAKGHTRLQVDAFAGEDRAEERRVRDDRYRQWQSEQAARNIQPGNPSGEPPSA